MKIRGTNPFPDDFTFNGGKWQIPQQKKLKRPACF